MDDTQNLGDQNNSGGQAPEGGAEAVPAKRVFEITPDLNITQTTEEISEEKYPEKMTEEALQAVVTSMSLKTPASPPPTGEPVTKPPISKLVATTPIQRTTISIPPESPDIKSIRTYESDVAEVLAHNKTSTTSIAIAENQKKDRGDTLNNSENSNRTAHSGKKLFISIASLALVAAGIGGAYYLYLESPLAPAAPAAQTGQTSVAIVPADSQTTIAIDHLSSLDILKRLQTENSKLMPPNSVKEIIPVMTSETGAITRVAAGDMIKIMDIKAPDMLTRSLTPEWMLGVYNDRDNNHSVFVIGTTNFFQNSFAGMLAWESVMADDLKQYLTSDFTSRGQFEDQIVKNKDVRAFVTTDGRVLFLYSFIDGVKLVVTKNSETLSAILTRLEKQSFVR